MNASERQITELARAIEAQIAAIADGTVTGPRYAAVARITSNVETLAAWIGDDR